MMYVALLRGINVGGNNIIKMVDLKTCFEKMGFLDVRTYIQSGNVVFSSSIRDIDTLISEIEVGLYRQFKIRIPVVVVSDKQLREVVESAPHGFGTQPDMYRYDVIFLKAPLMAKEAVENIPINPDVDRVYAGKRVLYFSRLIAEATRSRMSKIVSMHMYTYMTIRNWNTTTKLLEMSS